MKKFQSKYLIPIGSIIFGATFAGISLTQYELYEPSKGPMAGFMPALIGVLLVLVGVIDLVQARKYEEPEFSRENWLLVLGVLIVLAGHYICGILPVGFLFSFLWLRIKEKYSWKTTILTMVFLFVLVVGVFVIWLDIPFEYGIIGKMILK